VTRLLLVGVVAVGVAIAVWVAVPSSRDTTEVVRETPAKPAPGQPPIETETERTATPEEPPSTVPDYRIEQGGRLSLDARSLPAAGVVTLGLALDEDALGGGQDPLPAVIVSASDGRRLELLANPAPGSEGGVALGVDSAWLQPGSYMIQIRTAEKTALPLRRYVLEVRAAIGGLTPNDVSVETR
jgi:hypothetical protein